MEFAQQCSLVGQGVFEYLLPVVRLHGSSKSPVVRIVQGKHHFSWCRDWAGPRAGCRWSPAGTAIPAAPLCKPPNQGMAAGQVSPFLYHVTDLVMLAAT